MSGVDLEFDRIVDLTRDQGRVTFNDVSAERVCEDGASTLQKAMPALLTLISADMAGGCEWLLQTTAEYAKVRTQFDRPIGFFQAVKHPIVNMMILGDQTRSLVYAAACSYDTDQDDSHKAAHLAKSSASDTAEFCANRATQLHGGIGFTWEHDVQIYHKRVMHSQQLFGDGVWQRETGCSLFLTSRLPSNPPSNVSGPECTVPGIMSAFSRGRSVERGSSSLQHLSLPDRCAAAH